MKNQSTSASKAWIIVWMHMQYNQAKGLQFYFLAEIRSIICFTHILHKGFIGTGKMLQWQNTEQNSWMNHIADDYTNPTNQHNSLCQ